MKKYLLILCGLLALPALHAFERDTFPDIVPGQHTRLSGGVEYGFNDVWGHHANFDLAAKVPVHKHFDLMTALQMSTANVYNMNVEMDTKFMLTKLHQRELYLKSRFLFRGVVRANAYEFNLGFGLGYCRDYVDIMVGTNIRMMDEIKRRKTTQSTNEMIAETFYFIYGLEVFARPIDCNWNVSAKISNYTEYQVERMYNPIFSIAGRYDPAPQWRVMMRVFCKPAGMFNMTASFFDVHALAGFSYTF
jgi:hypothetical protein